MSNSERIFNITAGLSVVLWGVLGIFTSAGSARLTPVRICISLLNLLVGFLFLTRGPLIRQGAQYGVIASLPSLLVAGFAFKLSPPTDLWPVYAEIIFVMGAIFTAVSFIYLGRCFAVFPALRGTVTRGPFHVVRHPAYAGELFMIVGCFSADPTVVSIWPLVAALPCIILRIQAEEKVFKDEATYQGYAQKVVYRMFPGIW